MDDTAKNNSGFFCNRECEYFPCHETDDPDNFNCMFCYCPLYMLGDQCGGDFSYISGGIKDCSGCLKAHDPDFQDVITEKWEQIKQIATMKKPAGR